MWVACRTQGQERGQDERCSPTGELSSAAQGGDRTTPPARGSGAVVGDEVDVDRTGQPGDLGGGRAGEELPEAGVAGDPDDDHRRVDAAGELDDRLGHVVAHHGVEGPRQLLDQLARGVQLARVGAGQSVGAHHVDRDELAARRAGGDAGCAPDHRLALGAAGDGHDDPLARRPGLVDAVLAPVVVQGVVHPVGHPEQGELAQGGQVAHAEVRRERGVDLLGLVDVAVGHPPTQRLRAHVDQLDLVGRAHHGVGDRLALPHAGDPLDLVVEGGEVLDVDRGDDVDACAPDLLDVLAPLGVTASRHVGVGELVDQHHRGRPGDDRVGVHLGERRAAVGDLASRHDLQPLELGLGVRSPVGLDHAHDHVGPPRPAPVRLVEHGERLADARRGTEVDEELPAPWRALGTGHGLSLAGRRRPS